MATAPIRVRKKSEKNWLSTSLSLRSGPLACLWLCNSSQGFDFRKSILFWPNTRTTSELGQLKYTKSWPPWQSLAQVDLPRSVSLSLWFSLEGTTGAARWPRAQSETGQHPGQMNGGQRQFQSQSQSQSQSPSESDAGDEALTWTWAVTVPRAPGLQLVSVLKTSSAARDLYTTPRKRAPPAPRTRGSCSCPGSS